MKFIWLVIFILIFLAPVVSFALTPLLYYIIWGSLLFFLLVAFISEYKSAPLKNLEISVLCFLTYLVIPTVVSKDPAHSAHYLFNFSVCVFAFLVFARIDAEKKKIVASIILFSSFLIALYAIYQHCFAYRTFLRLISENKAIISEQCRGGILAAFKRGKAISVFTTANLLSSYLVMTTFLSLAYLLYANAIKRYLFILSVLISNLFAIFFTYRVSGVGSLCFGFVIFIILCLFKRPHIIKKYKAGWLLFAISIALIMITVLFLRTTGLCDRYYLEDMRQSLQARFAAWQILIAGLILHPFKFLGLGNFRLHPGNTYSVFVHNIFLQLWIEAGIVGMVIFIWFISSLIYRGLRKILVLDKNNFLDIGLFSAISAFLFAELAGYSFFIGQVAIIWWVFCGLLVAES